MAKKNKNNFSVKSRASVNGGNEANSKMFVFNRLKKFNDLCIDYLMNTGDISQVKKINIMKQSFWEMSVLISQLIRFADEDEVADMIKSQRSFLDITLAFNENVRGYFEEEQEIQPEV